MQNEQTLKELSDSIINVLKNRRNEMVQNVIKINEVITIFERLANKLTILADFIKTGTKIYFFVK